MSLCQFRQNSNDLKTTFEDDAASDFASVRHENGATDQGKGCRTPVCSTKGSPDMYQSLYAGTGGSHGEQAASSATFAAANVTSSSTLHVSSAATPT